MLHYVTREGGQLQRHYVNNFFAGEHNSNATIAILDYLLSSTQTFQKFDTIFFSGDTGSGFRQCETLYYYSTLKRKYGKK